MRKQLIALGIASLMLGGVYAAPSASAAPSYNNGGWFNSPGWGWGGGYGNGNGGGYGSGNGGTTTTSGSGGSQTSGNGASTAQASAGIEKMIAYGMTYMGTPYEFGSNRSTDTTFDCSDFVRWIFKEKLDVTLPSNSRDQGDYVREIGAVETDWRNLERGDLMFFMEYDGADAANYRNVKVYSERITHVGIYLGDGRILQTYSKDSGGVRIDTIAGSQWDNRFLFGGSAIK